MSRGWGNVETGTAFVEPLCGFLYDDVLAEGASRDTKRAMSRGLVRESERVEVPSSTPLIDFVLLDQVPGRRPLI